MLASYWVQVFIRMFCDPFRPLLQYVLFEEAPKLPIYPFRMTSFISVPCRAPICPRICASRGSALYVTILTHLASFFPFFPFTRDRYQNRYSCSVRFRQTSIHRRFNRFRNYLLRCSFSFSQFRSANVHCSTCRAIRICLVCRHGPKMRCPFTHLICVKRFFRCVLYRVSFLVWCHFGAYEARSGGLLSFLGGILFLFRWSAARDFNFVGVDFDYGGGAFSSVVVA